MPVYEQTYRSYNGVLKPKFRWFTIVQQEFRVLISRRMFLFLVLLGNFHFILRILQILVLDVLSKQQTGFFAEELGSAEFIETGAWVYFDFIRMQSPLLFITLIYAGSGLFCNDFRNNLLEIYFSKPLNWRDYAAGKIATLVIIGMSLSAVPALILGLIHVVFEPTMDALTETAMLAIPTILFSLLLVMSISLAILASSAFINSSRFAGIAIFMLAFVNMTFGVMLAVLTNEQNYLATAFPVSINYLGEVLFNEQRYENPITLAAIWPTLYVATICSAAFGLICMKCRRAEMGR